MESLKIAVLSPICWRTPPRHYGPWEQVASNITEGLVEKGHDVTLFATKDSFTSGKLDYISPRSYEEDKELDPKVWECLHIGHMMERAHDFDIIHNNYDFLPLTYSRLISTPMITTIHGFSSPKIIPAYKKYNDRVYYVSISNSDRSPELDYTATVYNGIDTHDFTFQGTPGSYLLFFGRIHNEKGVWESIQIAKTAGMELVISGFIQDQAYFDEKVKPFINNEDIKYVGNSGPIERDKLLGGAFALLHPINFEEPFGLSVAESMLCGTPVIAYNRGSMPELIEQGKTGFLVKNMAEAVERLKDIKDIDRAYCREWSNRKFSRDKMIADYIEVYKKIAG
ncbi:MAG: glycosyltransferase family 4 protein [Acidobacteria bacterium]|jgi:glycosyltransferase involved in cell wall biosynthesis|nr:glycosyltransferase family 4 protein [Acidobacteriota bacterium]